MNSSIKKKVTNENAQSFKAALTELPRLASGWWWGFCLTHKSASGQIVKTRQLFHCACLPDSAVKIKSMLQAFYIFFLHGYSEMIINAVREEFH